MADTRALVSDTNNNALYVVDLTSQTILVTFTPITSPGTLAVLPNATEGYATNNGGIPGHLYPVALPANTLGTTITVGNQPSFLVASPDGTHVYSLSVSTGTITPVATPANTVGAGITTSTTSFEWAVIDPASANLYALAQFNGVFPIAIPSNVVGANWGSGTFSGNVSALVIMPDGIHGFVAGTDIWPVDFITQVIGSPTTLPAFVDSAFLQPGGSQIFCNVSGFAEILVFNTTTSTVTTVTLPGGSGSQSGGFNSAGTTFYVPDIGSGNIYSINTTTLTLGPTWAFGGDPRFIAVVPTPTPPPTPSYPGSQFIPKLFIPQKGKVTVDYTQAELMANWLAIEIWSQRWLPPAPVALFFPTKNSTDPNAINANWIVLENWVNQINQAEKAPYPTLFIPRKASNRSTDLDVDFLRVQDWANGL